MRTRRCGRLSVRGEWMDYGWSSVAELQAKLMHLLEERHAGFVAELLITLEGDTLILRGEVASEDCKGDAKRLLIGFDSVFKVRNELVVAGFLQPANDDIDNYFDWKLPPTVSNPDQKGAERDALQSDGSRPDKTVTRKNYDPDRRPARRPGRDADVNPSTEAVEVVRHPIVKATGSMTPGTEVQVEVDLTVEGWQGASPMSLGRFPSDWRKITVSVQLVAPWASEMTVEQADIVVAADGTSQPACFTLVVSNNYVIGSPAQIYVSFLHGTRVCGYRSQDLVDVLNEKIEKTEETIADTADNIASAITINPNASGPSLSVIIHCNGKGPQTWIWRAQVPGGVEHGSEEINLADGDKAFAESLLRTCPNLDMKKFRRIMRGVGERLWEVAPMGFRSAFLGWRTKLGPDFPIQFISNDPHVPWEMMKPNVVGIDHLFLNHPVARWPLTRSGSLRPSFPSGALLSFVPEYEEDRALPLAKAEGEWVCSNLRATPMPATIAEFFDVLDGNYPTAVGILHFAGHGEIDTGISDGGIYMNDGLVSVGEVDQSTVLLGRQHGTLIVLNACETSATSQLLGMNTGWGNAIAAREFGGLIAPLWEVQDDVALAMVQAFLPPLIDGKLSLGAAVTAARCASSETSISAFAYLAHGDVMARFTRS